jgi:ribosomal protein S18 acetylase RimI-like enzyme
MLAVSREQQIRAIEENGAEFLLAMGRAGGGEELRQPDLHWTVGGSPIDYHNCVVRADLAPDGVDRAIAASIERFAALGVPGTWHVGPSMQPADLGDRLLARGFVAAGEDIGMAIALDPFPAAPPAPAALTIERVVDEPGLAAWVSVLARSFGEGPVEAEWVGKMYRRIGFVDDAPWRHLLGRLRGKPVATASLFIGGGATGVYFVSTLPAQRGQGIGAAITHAALRSGRDLGQRLAVLGASEAGVSVYRRLGFEELCRIALYEWRLR